MKIRKHVVFCVLISSLITIGLVSLRVGRADQGFTDPFPLLNNGPTATFIATVPDTLCWFDANVGCSPTTAFASSCSDNFQLGGWRDQSPNGFDAVQATYGTQPHWRTNQVNGRPAVVFNGYANTNLQWVATSADFAPREATAFCVCSAPWAVISSSTSWFWAQTGLKSTWSNTGGTGFTAYEAGVNDWSAHSQTVFGAGYGSGARPRAFGVISGLVDNTWHVFSWTVGTHSTCRMDGATTSTTSTGGSCNGIGVMSIGIDSTENATARMTVGSIAEVGLVNGIMPLTQIRRVEQWLGAKYNITVAPQ